MLMDDLSIAFVETMALAIALIAAWNRRLLAFAPAMRLPLAGLIVAIAVLPSASGAADYIDARLAVFFAYLAVASFAGPAGASAKRWLAIAAAIARVSRVAAAAPRLGRICASRLTTSAGRSALSRPAPGRWSSRRRPRRLRRSATIFAASPISSSSTAGRWFRPCSPAKGCSRSCSSTRG